MDKKKILIASLLVFLFSFACVFSLILRDGNKLHDNGPGAYDTGKQLEQIGDELAEEERVINEARIRVEESGGRIAESGKLNREVRDLQQADYALIEECRRIIAEIRTRGIT